MSTRKFLATIAACLFLAATTIAQNAPPQHSHDGGFMQGHIRHTIAKGVTLNAKADVATHIITIREGPLSLPANTSHHEMPQPPDLHWNISIDGWLLGYTPRLVDANGNSVPGTGLHHTAFWNTNRPDFLCPNKEEHIFGAGGELTDWQQIPGYGYRVHAGDNIRIETMVHNPTATSYDRVYLEVSIPYQDATQPADSTLKNYYPAWMDVSSCGNSGYNLPAGKSEKSGTVKIKYPGVLLGVGGHMHDYATALVLENASRKDIVATLPAKVDDQGHLISMPTALFLDRGGYRFAANDTLKIEATYNNITGKPIPDGAMGIVVGYFVPTDDSEVASLRRPSFKPAAAKPPATKTTPGAKSAE